MEAFLSVKRMLAVSWVYLVVLTVGTWIFGSWTFAWAVMAGGLISIGSFRVSLKDMTAFVKRLPVGQEQADGKERGRKGTKGLILKFWLRLLVIAVVLAGLIRFGNINIFGLILGLTTVVFSITFTAIDAVWRYYFSRR
ncbi:MAG: hypothetical protein CSA26_04265 [Desulfobacterales bacterium]|nr:MAG: hypothetical protein CSA26_04265 [Desulfobacterales bacterium]